MYVELDKNLVAGEIKHMNNQKQLPGREMVVTGTGKDAVQHFKVHTYYVEEKTSIMEVLEQRKEFADFEAVVGSKEEIYYDLDFGFFSAVVACYNNHWVLKTSPDDWWNVIVRNVAQAIDENGEKEAVRNHFVSYQKKKRVEIELPTGQGMHNVDYSWLFKQFAEAIKKIIKVPGYVDTMQADFSTTSPVQLISTQVMLMSSVQKYIDHHYRTACGIPGVEMLGTEKDWERLVQKTSKLEEMLQPVMEEVNLGRWFSTTRDTLKKLEQTYKGYPDTKWWSNILSWNDSYGSGARAWWTGWMIDFLVSSKPETSRDFVQSGNGIEVEDFVQSGVVSVPITIKDVDAEDKGMLVAGTIGYTVEKGEGDKAPMVQAKQGWALFLPRESLITPRIRGQFL